MGLWAIVLAAQAGGGATFEDLSAQAAAARDANDVPRAIELYRRAVELNPKWEEGWWYLGSLYYDADRYREGRDALAHVVELDAKAMPAFALLGLCEFEAGDYNASLEHVERALGNVPPQMESVLRFHEAMLWTRDGQFDRALQAYTWFAQRGIENAELTQAIGLAALRSAKVPREISAGDRELYTAAGRAAYLSMSGQIVAAQQAYEGLMERFPRAHNVHYLYGCFLLAAKPEVGAEELRKEVELSPESGAASAMLAWILLQQGDKAGAAQFARKAVEREPAMPLAQYAMGRCLLEEGKIESGIEHLQLAEKGDANSLETHASLATAYARAGRVADERRERVATLELWKARDPNANR